MCFLVKWEKNGNNARLVRNVGIVDDDISFLKTEIKNLPKVECVIFRMMDLKGNILPSQNRDNFYINNTGISFCYKKKLFNENSLILLLSNYEDFEILNKMRQHGKKIIISQYITYYVRHEIIPPNMINIKLI